MDADALRGRAEARRNPPLPTVAAIVCEAVDCQEYAMHTTAVGSFCARHMAAVARRFGWLAPSGRVTQPREVAGDGEAAANQRLIAASPDLRDALHWLLRWAVNGDLEGRMWGDVYDAAVRALAKATGETM